LSKLSGKIEKILLLKLKKIKIKIKVCLFSGEKKRVRPSSVIFNKIIYSFVYVSNILEI
jgi:hypothetical protein